MQVVGHALSVKLNLIGILHKTMNILQTSCSFYRIILIQIFIGLLIKFNALAMKTTHIHNAHRTSLKMDM